MIKQRKPPKQSLINEIIYCSINCFLIPEQYLNHGHNRRYSNIYYIPYNHKTKKKTPQTIAYKRDNKLEHQLLLNVDCSTQKTRSETPSVPYNIIFFQASAVVITGCGRTLPKRLESRFLASWTVLGPESETLHHAERTTFNCSRGGTGCTRHARDTEPRAHTDRASQIQH